MIFSQLFSTRFSTIAITLLTVFILSSCSPVEETFDKTINASISDITDDSKITPYPKLPIAPLETTRPTIPVDINTPVDSIAVIDLDLPVEPVAPVEPIVVIDPLPPANPRDPIVIIDPLPPVNPIDAIVIIDPLPPVDPVPPVQANQAQLSWVAPSAREDASPLLLSEIAGYKIYFGSTQGIYSNTIDVNDSTAMSYVFTELTTGTYYVVVTTYDTDGRESQYSSEVMVNV